MKILKVLLLSFALLSVFGSVAAEETLDVALDENVTVQDLGIAEPNLLPDSPLYLFKNWGREIQSALTLNPIKKAELREKFANEKLIELKLLVEKKKDSPIIEKATENYRKEIEKTKKAAENIKETTEENPQVGTFLNKFIQQQILHQRILEKLETQVSTTTLAKIQEAREKHLEKFGEVMTKLENRQEKIKERLEEKFAEIKGSEFKDFKNQELLRALEEKVPENVKEAIREIRENSLIQLKTKIEEMPSEKIEKFKDYIEKSSGEKEKQMEILENLRDRIKDKPLIQQKLNETRQKIMETIGACAQVITYRKNPQTGQCQQFSSPCDAPQDWQKCVGVELLIKEKTEAK